MVTSNIGEGMGKKIVEALMMTSGSSSVENNFNTESSILNNESDNVVVADVQMSSNTLPSQQAMESAFQQSLSQNIPNYNTAQVEEFDCPTNVAILRQLIAKLPSGVSKQTGALIIRQTMEALGISMVSVLQEAQQVRENLILGTKECQNNIADCKKQISILELKSQQYQRQATSMNDIINLFNMTGMN